MSSRRTIQGLAKHYEEFGKHHGLDTETSRALGCFLMGDLRANSYVVMQINMEQANAAS